MLKSYKFQVKALFLSIRPLLMKATQNLPSGLEAFLTYSAETRCLQLAVLASQISSSRNTASMPLLCRYWRREASSPAWVSSTKSPPQAPNDLTTPQ